MKFLNAPYYLALGNNNTEHLELFPSEVRMSENNFPPVIEATVHILHQ